MNIAEEKIPPLPWKPLWMPVYEPSDDSAERLPDYLDGKAAVSLIKKLPKKYHKVMQMKHVQMLAHEEIAKIIGQSKNTVAVQLHRGLIKLRVLYNANDSKKSSIAYSKNPLEIMPQESK